ncbi:MULTISPECIES: tyrosine-type recombinase/integrase [Rhodobacterales]|uniref:tyrosine-type recombinase/integrase n=1 Tax=Rhodobacterales TaxID=204455 RepID=UPI001FB59DF0|nr:MULTISPECIES: tyrosine-type recombinase/integrase [Rhodobacterales]
MKAATETAWNKGRVVGKKPPLMPDQVSLIRMILRQEKALRDLALFNTALDTSFRGSDLVRLRVSDVATLAGVREIVEIRQKKTETRNARPVQARLSSGTRDSLRAYLADSEKPLHGWLFTGQGARWADTHLSESQLWRLFRSWLEKARLDPSLYGLHSLRRTFPTYIYQQTGNLRAAQLLLGHASIESTKEYIGTEQAEALEIARKYHL